MRGKLVEVRRAGSALTLTFRVDGDDAPRVWGSTGVGEDWRLAPACDRGAAYLRAQRRDLERLIAECDPEDVTRLGFENRLAAVEEELADIEEKLAEETCECGEALLGETHDCSALPTCDGPEMMPLEPEGEQ